jgi:hypothetical protein
MCGHLLTLQLAKFTTISNSAIVRRLIYLTFIVAAHSKISAQNNPDLIFPDSLGWNVINENQNLSFWIRTSDPKQAHFSLEGAENLGIRFDSLGNFQWQPTFDLVDRVEKLKDFTVIFQASWADGRRTRKAITFAVNHVNRPPVVEEVPTFYVKQSNLNSYQISGDYVFDPDGDPFGFLR